MIMLYSVMLTKVEIKRRRGGPGARWVGSSTAAMAAPFEDPKVSG